LDRLHDNDDEDVSMTEIIKDFNQIPAVDEKVAAQLLQVTRSRVEAMRIDGIIKRQGTSQSYHYPIGDLFIDFTNHLKRESRKPTISADRVRNAKAREIEIRSAERAGRLMDVEEVEARLVSLVGKIRSMHVALSSRVTRDLALRKIIDREINAIDAATADWLETLAEDIEKGREGDAAALVDDSGRVGVKKSDLSGDGADSGST
jgi:hypothetical protein